MKISRRGRKSSGRSLALVVAIPLAIPLVIPLAATSFACGGRSGLFGLELEGPGGVTAFALDSGGSPSSTDAMSPSPPEEGGVEATDSSPPAQVVTACVDASTDQAAYLLAEDGAFYRFDPGPVTWSRLGTISCSGTPGGGTMAVTEESAYVLYGPNSLYRVDLETLACTKTPFDAQPIGLDYIELASLYVGGKEWLYAYGCVSDAPGGTCTPTLARADLTTFAIEVVGPVGPAPFYDPLSVSIAINGDGYGRLFGLSGEGTVVQIDPTNAHVLAAATTAFLSLPNWALLTWDDSIYLFAEESGQIGSYNFTTGKLAQLGALNDTIIASGAAPCVH